VDAKFSTDSKQHTKLRRLRGFTEPRVLHILAKAIPKWTETIHAAGRRC
jgi:hypothetical protein